MGEMRSGGQTYLGDIAHLEMGQSPPSACVIDGLNQGRPFLQGNAEFGPTHPSPRQACLKPQKVCEEGDVLISVRAPVGAINLADRKYCIGRGLAAIRFHSADPAFGGHALGVAAAALRRVAQGTTFEAVGRRELAALAIWLPSFPEQQQIAAVLDTIDEAIRRTEQIIAKLKQIKQGLLHDLLTRGINDNGELRDPLRHPEQFKDSALGRIPKEWDVGPLGGVLAGSTYGISSALTSGPGIPVLRMNNLRDGEAELSEIKYSARSEAKDLLLKTGDVLFNRTNSLEHVGRTGIWRGQIAKASFASYLVRLEPNSEKLAGEFLNRWLNWEATQIRIRRFATPGVHQVNINPTNLKRTIIGVPMVAEQRGIVEALAASDQRIGLEVSHGSKLRLLKAGLMEDLLTGRVRVTPLLEGATR